MPNSHAPKASVCLEKRHPKRHPVNARIDKLAAELNARIGEMASKADLAELKAEMEKRFGEQARYLAQQFTGQQRFLYFAMAMQIAATLSLWLR